MEDTSLRTVPVVYNDLGHCLRDGKPVCDQSSVHWTLACWLVWYSLAVYQQWSPPTSWWRLRAMVTRLWPWWVNTREFSGAFCDTSVNRSLHRLYFYGSLDMWPIGKTALNRGGRQQRVICKRRPSKRSFTSEKMYLDHKNNNAVNHAICKSLHHLSF